MHQIKLGLHKELNIKGSPLFTDKELEEAVCLSINELANSWYKNNKAIEPWDEVIVDLIAECEEKFVPELSREDYRYTVGNPSLWTEFHNVIGRKKGYSFLIELKLNEDVLIERIAGKRVVISGVIKDVIPPKKIELTDELAQCIDASVSGMTELKNKMRKVISDNLNDMVRENNINLVLDEIKARSEYQLEQTGVQEEYEKIMQSMQRQMFSYQDKEHMLETLLQPDEHYLNDCRLLAERVIVHNLIIEEFIRQEKVSVSDDEIKTGRQELKNKLPDTQLFQNLFPTAESIHLYLLREKAIDLLIQANILS